MSIVRPIPPIQAKSLIRILWPRNHEGAETIPFDLKLDLSADDLQGDALLRMFFDQIKDAELSSLERSQAMASLIWRVAWLKATPEQRALVGEPEAATPGVRALDL